MTPSDSFLSSLASNPFFPDRTYNDIRVFAFRPATSTNIRVSFPQEHVLLLTFNRPDKRNVIDSTLSQEIGNVLAWFDEEPSLWVVIITGEGQVFCGGGDLKVWHHKQSSGTSTEVEEMATSLHGFASITRRHTSLKPMIAAVNGPAYGGGVEILLNCDLVIASQDAVFALPEVKRGIMAGQGGQCVLTRTLQVVNACRHACICCSNLPESVPVFSVLTFTVM